MEISFMDSLGKPRPSYKKVMNLKLCVPQTTVTTGTCVY